MDHDLDGGDKNRLDDHHIGQLRKPTALNHMGRDHKMAGDVDQLALV